MRGQFTREWLEAITAFCLYLVAAGSPLTTVRTRRDHLAHLGRRIGCGPFELDGPRLLAWFSGQTWAPETRRGKRGTFRAFYSWAVDDGRIPVNPAAVLPRVPPGRPNPQPTPDGVYAAAVAAADPRTRLMLRLPTGQVRHEIAGVCLRDLGPPHPQLGGQLLVHGKGQRDRLVPVPDGLAAVLRAAPAGYLFPGRDQGHLSPRWVGTMVARLMPEAWTMHKLRHRAATR